MNESPFFSDLMEFVDRPPARNGCAYAQSNKKRLNDESIAVQIIFLGVYTWN